MHHPVDQQYTFYFNEWDNKQKCKDLRDYTEMNRLRESCPSRYFWHYDVLCTLDELPDWMQEAVQQCHTTI